MPVVWIPALLRDLTDGQPSVQMPGNTVRQVIDNLEERYPGIRRRLCDGDRLHPSISVAVDGEVSLVGMRQRVQETSEIHFLPAISGG